MNSERIGQAAGVVWKRLYSRGMTGIPLADLKKVPGFTGDELMAGLGWLAREGKLSFQVQGKKLTVTLVEDEILATT